MHRLLQSLVLIAALFCVTASLVHPWFEVPISVSTSADSLVDGKVVTGSSIWSNGFRVVAIGATLLVLSIRGLLRYSRSAATVIAAFGLVAILLFPHCQIVWQPELSAQAAWLQIQHENLTWFGGDIFRSQEVETTPSQMQMYLSDSPRQVAVMKLPTWQLSAFRLHRLPAVLEWGGYTNTFCQFVAGGWPLAVVGFTLLLLSTFYDRQQVCIPRVRIAVITLLLGGVVGLVVVGVAPFRASVRLQRAANATHRGQHAAALKALKSAHQAWPPLGEDTWFVAQLGLTQHLVGVKSAHSDLHRARVRERNRQIDAALAEFRRLADDSEVPRSVRREACRGVLRHAIRALNSGEPSKAARDFQFVLRIEPCNIKSIYALQVVYGQLGQADEVITAHRQLSAVYEHLNFPDKRIVLGKSLAMAERPWLFGKTEPDTSRHQTAKRQLVQSSK